MTERVQIAAALNILLEIVFSGTFKIEFLFKVYEVDPYPGGNLRHLTGTCGWNIVGVVRT